MNISYKQVVFCIFLLVFSANLYSNGFNISGLKFTHPLVDYTTINVSEAKDLINNSSDLFILDVRTEDEYIDGHIEEAYLIPHTNILSRQEELPSNKSQSILVYCRSGTRSAIASNTLVSLNYTAIYNMDGGFLAWKEAGYPYVTGYPSTSESTSTTQESTTINTTQTISQTETSTQSTREINASFWTIFPILSLVLIFKKRKK
ncbi:MAG: rhodanese-like domain-containing protein [Promethearchaeota archaeon]